MAPKMLLKKRHVVRLLRLVPKDRFRYLRKEILKITQPKLAELAGLSVQSISAYERGRRMPSKKSAERLSKAFGVNLQIVLAENMPEGRMLTYLALDRITDPEDFETVSKIIRDYADRQKVPKLSPE